MQGAAWADIQGSSDHPLFPRFAGSEIIGHKVSDYDELIMALGKAYDAGYNDKRLEKDKRVEGRITRNLYLLPAEKTTLQVFRNYEKTLKAQGFSTLFSCAGNGGCGWWSWFVGAQTLGGLRDYATQLGGDFRYLSAYLQRKEGDIYVSLLVYNYDSSVVRAWAGRTMAELNVVEVEPMQQEMVFIKAKDLANGITQQGHIALHQIHFDTDSDIIKADSRPAIDQIALMLKNNPDLKIILVGHTDNQGDLQYNMDLSQRRAKAVMNSLESDYGIKRARLGAAGIGYLAPIASNRSAEGRAENRRVEIIEQ
ncbi:hypothetical protein AL013_07310 [Mariprofundus ferrooxydans]|nr:hypothetical protein AL013_07310 [Mariprofundus ferrooxydans]